MNSIKDIYNAMLQKSENDFEKVGWGSKKSQITRFHVLMEVGNLEKRSILDVGCGLGAMLDYIDKNISIQSYTGIDINSNMIKEAKKRHPNAEFKTLDITKNLEELSNKRFDYVFLSGALNLSADNHEENIKKVIKKMFGLANKAIALNFLSIFSDRFTQAEYYCSPLEILEFSFTLTKKVTLRHDYMPHDFTIYLYK